MTENNYFSVLNSIDVGEKTESKNGLTYLSWAWAWGELKKRHPDAVYTIYENRDGWFYHTDGKTGWVKTGVTVNGIEHIEYLPIMNYQNKSIPADKITSFDVNKAIQRSLTKAVARHGLGLYIYAGEDLPEDALGDTETLPFEVKPERKPERKKEDKRDEEVFICSECHNVIRDAYKNGVISKTAKEVAEMTEKEFGARLCVSCAKKRS